LIKFTKESEKDYNLLPRLSKITCENWFGYSFLKVLYPKLIYKRNEQYLDLVYQSAKGYRSYEIRRYSIAYLKIIG